MVSPHLLDRTREYPRGGSGATTVARRDPVGPAVAAAEALAAWLPVR